MPVRQQHLRVLGADAEFDQPVLVGLEAGGLSELAAEFEIIGRRHRREHVPRRDHLFEDAGHARHRLEGRRQLVLLDIGDRRIQLMRHQVQPQFLDVMDGDEQVFVVLVGERFLGGEQRVELQIVAIGHAPGEIDMDVVADAACGWRLVCGHF